MTQLKIQIPDPCNKKWDKMIPDENGRYCNSCDKIVVDFTQMNKEEIKNYFMLMRDVKVCGHFKLSQVEIKQPYIHRRLFALYEKAESKVRILFLKKAYLFLLTGCMVIVGCGNPKNQLVDGKTVPKTGDSTVLTGDSVVHHVPLNDSMVDGTEKLRDLDSIQNK